MKKTSGKAMSRSYLLICSFVFALILALAIGFQSSAMFSQAKMNLNPDISKPQFFVKYSDIKEARKAGNELNVRIAEEGIALFKNELCSDGKKALPVAKGSNVSLFGSCSSNLRQTGNGSGGGVALSGETINTEDAFNAVGLNVNPTLYDLYVSRNSRSEIPVSNYTSSITSTYKDYNDLAVIFISRADGGENYDAQLGNGTSAHSMEMSSNEQALFNHVKDAKDDNGEPMFKKIILCINTADPFEVARYQDDERVQGVIWMGFLGGLGLKALPYIITGEVNPSAHTVDVWPASLRKDPAWFNFGSNRQVGGSLVIKGNDPSGGSLENPVRTDGKAGAPQMKALTYKEGIYMGYRWYETAATVDGYFDTAEDKQDPLHSDDAYYNRTNGVLYPFGYGLSYTDFEWTVGEPDKAEGILTDSDAGDKVTVPVTVKNTGEVAGKDVVQIYLRAPYDTETAPIEKSEITFINSAKTKLLQPDEEQTVYVSFDIRDLASFDWNDINGNDFQGYELEQGNYEILFRTDSHTDKNEGFKLTYTVGENGIQYDEEGDSPLNYNRGFGENAKAVFSQNDIYNTSGIGAIDEDGTHVAKKDADYVSRSAWALPTPSDDDQLSWTDKAVSVLFNQSYTSSAGTNGDKPTDPWYKTAEDIPGYGKSRSELTATDWKQASEEDVNARRNGKTALQLSDMIGVPIDDAKWVTFMNQLTFDEMTYISNNSRYTSPALPAIGKPATIDRDGPGQVVSATSERSTFWCCETTIAATYNTELAYEMGYQLGQECILLGVTGWYGPGVNIHRLAFNGRNFEYYSQDGRQGGWIAAAVIKGATDNGIHVFAKHYVCNDMETDRNSGGGVSIFLTEQALREIYLKPFEIATKYGNMNGMMTAHGKVGVLRIESNYNLCNYFLYDECGYDGSSVTDAISNDFTTIINGSAQQVTGDRLARCRVLPLSWNTTPASSLSACTGRRTEGRYDAESNKLLVPTITVDQSTWTYSGTGTSTDAMNYGYEAEVTCDDNWIVESPTQWYSVRMNAMYMLYQTANSCQMTGGIGDQVGYVVSVHYADGTTEINCSLSEIIAEPDAPVIDASKQRFVGWYLDEECTVPAEFPINVTGPVHLYPLIVGMTSCVQTYSLNYDGAGENKAEYYEKGTTVSLPVFDPVRPGYTFEGWYFDAACIKKVDSSDLSSLVINNDRTFYAKWKATSVYQVSFDYNYDDCPAPKTMTVAAGETIMPPLYPPTRAGYTFTGWYTDQGCEYKADFSAGIEYDIKFYAGWAEASADTEDGGCNSSADIFTFGGCACSIALSLVAVVLLARLVRKKR